MAEPTTPTPPTVTLAEASTDRGQGVVPLTYDALRRARARTDFPHATVALNSAGRTAARYQTDDLLAWYQNHPQPDVSPIATPLGDQSLWAHHPDVLEACVAGRLALWATAHPVEQPAGGWRIVDDAGNPVDARARMPGQSILGARAAPRNIRDDRAIIPPDVRSGPGRYDNELRFPTRDAAEAFLVDQRRRAAWLVMWGLLHPLPGNLDDLNPRTVDLYRSLCLDHTHTPDERHHQILTDRYAPDRCDCPHRHGR